MDIQGITFFDIIAYFIGIIVISLLIVVVISIIGVAFAHALRATLRSQKFYQRKDTTKQCTNTRDYHEKPINPVQYIHYLYHRIYEFFRKYIYLYNNGNYQYCKRTKKNTINMIHDPIHDGTISCDKTKGQPKENFTD